MSGVKTTMLIDARYRGSADQIEERRMRTILTREEGQTMPAMAVHAQHGSTAARQKVHGVVPRGRSGDR